ncbi:hypothetical protein HYR99_31650 [Candidatus Poribacteria bacterium]|nr:hypothetical protein [Candidatus Poribacteria bacterium]
MLVGRGVVSDVLWICDPGTLIKDDGIPTLLHRVRQPTFVTINITDFWGRTPADRRYCILCFPLPIRRVHEISGLLRRVFRLPEFRTKVARMGKVALVGHQQVQYYQVGDSQRYSLPLG